LVCGLLGLEERRRYQPQSRALSYQQFLFQNGEMVPEIAQARLFSAFSD